MSIFAAGCDEITQIETSKGVNLRNISRIRSCMALRHLVLIIRDHFAKTFPHVHRGRFRSECVNNDNKPPTTSDIDGHRRFTHFVIHGDYVITRGRRVVPVKFLCNKKAQILTEYCAIHCQLGLLTVLYPQQHNFGSKRGYRQTPEAIRKIKLLTKLMFDTSNVISLQHSLSLRWVDR